MTKSESKQTNLSSSEDFKMRGTQITRLETFMDAAFAFAMTMLVISVGTIPKNYPELIISLKEIPAFVCSFFIIMTFWLSHRTWSRRYGLEDKNTIFLSISLIFILLIYMYPLRLIFSNLFAWLSNGWFPSTFEVKSKSELIGLFVIYGIGLFAMAGIISLLYLRAYSKRIFLKLNKFEVHKTKNKITLLAAVSFTGLVATFLALILSENLALWSVLTYLTIPITVTFINRFYKKNK
ncbi:TMEM175 family protein [Lutibacter citreus]|uniref:TMEM175 family protein n=1 Tax=Lutibacter citreus TaxID=2138210 RepID=UPI000DBE0C7B|nr:TMEM175 family protein [Lutibacter citreus]